MSKRWISLLLVLCLVFSLLPASAAASEAGADGAPENTAYHNPFADVSEGAWYYDDVLFVYENGIFNGVSDSDFAPGSSMSRAMFVTVLGRMAGVKTENYTGGTVFTDVGANAWYAPYVAWAVKYGITNGTGPDTFTPDAPITRQEMAVFFVRYFEVFDIDYGADKADTQAVPDDLDTVAAWAKDSVVKLWRVGLLNGDGVSFDPTSRATRAQAAAICHRACNAVDEWRSELVRQEGPDDYYSVAFYDGSRRIATLRTLKGEPLGRVPTVEQSSRAGAILIGYYTDREFTRPFYADEPVTRNMSVYGKYQEMESTEILNFTSFAQMDMEPDLSFTIRRISGSIAPGSSATLTVKDGSAPVKLKFTTVSGAAPEPAADDGAAEFTPGTGTEPAPAPEPVELVCTVSADGGFNRGCSYELTLADGWIFDGKPETIRTASFSIYKDAVDHMRMSSEIKYLEDTDDLIYTVSGKTYAVLTSALAAEGGEIKYKSDKPDESAAETGSGEITAYADTAGTGIPDLAAGDILCVYVGVHPDERTAGIGKGSLDGSVLLDPAVYVEVSSVEDGKIGFRPLEEDDRSSLYDVPDNFPLMVSTMPTGNAGAAYIDLLDISMYEQMLGKTDGNLAYARTKINVGDFVTLYTGAITAESDLYFGEITAYDESTGAITYTKTTKQTIIESMELYAPIDLDGDDLVTEKQKQELIEAVEDQLEESDFGEQAAQMLAELVIATDEFQNNPVISGLLGPDENGIYTAEAMKSLASALKLDRGSTEITVRLITSGKDLHFSGGVQLAVDVSAKINAPIGNSLSNTLSIDLDGTFIEELYVKPTVKGSLVTKEILFIPVPIGVELGASIDIKNYTAIRFDAEISTHDNSGILYSSSISSDLQDMLKASGGKKGLSDNYQSSLAALMERYSDLLRQETDWITLIEEPIFKDVEVGIKAIGIGIEGNFVVKTDMSIAIGSKLEYETGKRYSFWFRVGLFTPTAGSSTMDLIDESFAFQFYVMGKLGVRAGVKLLLYVQIGGGKLAKAGVSADLGPYIKLYGFFIYEVSKYRPKNTNSWKYSEQMAGALYLEFGLYFTLGFEASALSVFEYSKDFLDEEIPLLTAGDSRYYYGFNYNPDKDEFVVIRNDNQVEPPVDEKGVELRYASMILPDGLREMTYMTLNTGYRGYASLPLDRYNFTVSNPNFTFDKATGRAGVTVPNEKTHFMQCGLTTTYLYGKLAFSNYDMSVIVPLVWTDLNEDQLKEFFTVSVRVGSGNGDYETVWSKRVLRGQEFDLPTDGDIRELIGYSDGSWKYASAPGYASGQQLEALTVNTDTVYDYSVTYRTYTLTVDGIQNTDGSTRSETFTAKYGQAFDFSSLKRTGTDSDEKGMYTKFANVTAPGLDLTQPINESMAVKLIEGVAATANYVDDSVTAVFTFNGIPHEDVLVKCRRGTVPGTAAVEKAVVDGNYDENVAVTAITPELGRIENSTNYVVTCVTLSGERANISFDMNLSRGGYLDERGIAYDELAAPAALDRLVGSLIINLPKVERTGYKFDGWYTRPFDGVLLTASAATYDGSFDVPDGCYTAETRTVPEEGITLYAHWSPCTYTVNFDIGDGDKIDSKDRTRVKSKTVVYDEPYGLYGLGEVEPYGYNSSGSLGELPWPKAADGKRFFSWDFGKEYGEMITRNTVFKTDGDVTLRAFYKPLVKIDPNWIDFGDTETFTYSTDCVQSAEYDYVEQYAVFEDRTVGKEETVNLPKDSFILNYTEPYYSDSTRKPVNAGTYKVMVTRVADEMFAAFEETHKDVLTITKATRDLSGARPEKITDRSGCNYLTLGAGIYDLYPGAEVKIGMKIGSQQGTVTGDGSCFFSGLDKNNSFTATLTSVSVRNDRNYYDITASPNATANISTNPAPSGSWSSHASSLTTEISTPAQMAALMNEINSGNACTGMEFNLKADIDMSTHTWDTSGATFNGTFNGNGHAIYGIYSYCSGSNNVGLFGVLGGDAIVRNVLLAGGSIEGSRVVGGIAGYGNDGAIIDNCVNYATVKASGSGETDAGGIVGGVSENQNDGKGTQVHNCVNYGSISGSGKHTGGIIGYQMGSSTLVNCANYGGIYGEDEGIGGILGANFNRTSHVYNIVNAGRVTGTGSYRGAIVGRNDGDDGEVYQGYYLEGSAPERKGAGLGNGAQNDDHGGLKLTSFTSYTGAPARVVEDSCTGSMTLLQVLNHWVNHYGSKYGADTWTLTGLGGAPVPKNIPTL